MQKEKLTECIPKYDSWLLPRENGMLLSDYQVRVLQNNNIDYLKYKDYKELLFTLNEMDLDDDELDEVALAIGEMDYYNK